MSKYKDLTKQLGEDAPHATVFVVRHSCGCVCKVVACDNRVLHTPMAKQLHEILQSFRDSGHTIDSMSAEAFDQLDASKLQLISSCNHGSSHDKNVTLSA